MARSCGLLLAITLLLLAGAAAAQPALADLAGDYVFAGGQQQRAAVDRAIESVVSEMNVIYRVIARRRLKAAATIAPSCSFKVSPAGMVSIKMGAGPYRETKTDGTPIRYANEEGQDIRLQRTWRNGVLTTVGDRGDASQRNVYQLSVDRSRLTVTITITSEPLPRPLTYRLTYRRRD